MLLLPDCHLPKARAACHGLREDICAVAANAVCTVAEAIEPFKAAQPHQGARRSSSTDSVPIVTPQCLELEPTEFSKIILKRPRFKPLRASVATSQSSREWSVFAPAETTRTHHQQYQRVNSNSLNAHNLSNNRLGSKISLFTMPSMRHRFIFARASKCVKSLAI